MIDISPVERIRLMRELDVDAVLAMPGAGSVLKGGFKDTGVFADARETTLAGLHRGRLMSPAYFTEAERAESRKWLFENGWRVDMARVG